MCVLINAPVLFSGIYKMVRPILDARVQAKIHFLKGDKSAQALKERLGDETTNWLLAEMQDNKDSKSEAKKGNLKKYWVAPSDGSKHDPRGVASYIGCQYYIKTPGDAFEEQQKSQN